MLYIVREFKGIELYFTALCMLLGEEGIDYAKYEEDEDWWRLRLFISRN